MGISGGIPQTVIPINFSPFPSAEASGGSYISGDVNVSPRNFPKIFADMLGIPLTNRGVAGAAATSSQVSPAGNGYAALLQALSRGSSTGPWPLASPLYILHIGDNDGVAGIPLSVIRMARRTMISRMRVPTGGVYEESDSSHVFSTPGAAWAQQASVLSNSGAGYKVSNVVGAADTITIGSGFPGGTVALGITCLSSGNSAVFNFTMDGSAAGSLNTASYQATWAGKANLMGAVQRFTGLAPGSHTLVATIASAVGNGAGIDYWQLESPTPGLVLVCDQPQIPGQSTANSIATQQDNSQLQQLIAEFDLQVRLVELDNVIGQQASMWNATFNHPNDLGLSQMATAAAFIAQDGPWASQYALVTS